MSEHPLQFLFQGFTKVSECIQTNLSRFIPRHEYPSSSLSTNKASLITLSATNHLRQPEEVLNKKSVGPTTKEELGRATWTFLHTLAAQVLVLDNHPFEFLFIFSSNKVSFLAFLGKTVTPQWLFSYALLFHFLIFYPDKPTRQQKKDVKELMEILSRMYPCKECADHFKEVIRANPVVAGSHDEFSQWLCHAHNVVNRSLGKVVFPCERVDARWGKLECEQRACDLQGATMDFSSDLKR